MKVLKTSRVVYVFQFLKSKPAFLLTKYSVDRSSEQICLELQGWMSSFLNIRSCDEKLFCTKDVLKIFAKFIEKYPWCSSLHNARYTNSMPTRLEKTEKRLEKNWVARSNWMNGNKYDYTANARFSQGLLQLLFAFFDQKPSKWVYTVIYYNFSFFIEFKHIFCLPKKPR